MSAFLYYVPASKIAKGSKPTIEELRSYGLGHVFDDATTARDVHGGPDGMNGVIMSTQDHAGRFKFDRAGQEWREIGPQVWLGWWKDSPPTPDDTAREPQLSGEWVRFDDGSRWLIPHAREWIEDGDEMLQSCSLPRRFVLNESGEFVLGGVKSRYQQLWDLVRGYERAMAEGEIRDGMVHFSFDGITDLAVAGLSTNYRIGKYELDSLGVFDQEARDAIIDVIRDQRTWKAWAKKKSASVAAGDHVSDGHEQSTEDSAPSTDPPSPTCGPGNTAGIHAEASV